MQVLIAKLQNPRRWGRDPRCAALASVVGLCVGGWLSWYFSQPIPPWLEFYQIGLIHHLGSPNIELFAEYEVNRLCEGTAKQSIGWRVELVAPDGQVHSYRPASPPLTRGEHRYNARLPIDPAMMDMRGAWSGVIIAVCLDEGLHTSLSPSATLLHLGDEESPP